jgi:hypothetical protein
MNAKNKLIILGDSFCTGFTIHRTMTGDINDIQNYFWVNDLQKHYENTHELILDSYPSRDIQTIIDNWIKLIKHINKEDILIVGVPFFSRIRVPLATKDFQIKDYDIDDFSIINRFVTHHSWYKTDSEKLYLGDSVVEKKDLDFHVTFLEQLYFNSEGVEQNYNEVIKSLYDLTNCKKYFFSWDNMKNRLEEIEYKDDLTKKLGWTTLDDLYNDTDGKFGRKGDFHWDYRFQKKFANYLIEKFKI